jgi:hypothetical protein
VNGASPFDIKLKLLSKIIPILRQALFLFGSEHVLFRGPLGEIFFKERRELAGQGDRPILVLEHGPMFRIIDYVDEIILEVEPANLSPADFTLTETGMEPAIEDEPKIVVWCVLNQPLNSFLPQPVEATLGRSLWTFKPIERVICHHTFPVQPPTKCEDISGITDEGFLGIFCLLQTG